MEAPPLGRAAEAGAAEVAPAAKRVIGLATGPVVAPEPVLTPLPDIAEHVLQPPDVGLLLTDRMRLSVRILTVPRHLPCVAMPRRSTPRPAAILPLRLRRQPIFPALGEYTRLAVECRELLTEVTGLIPS